MTQAKHTVKHRLQCPFFNQECLYPQLLAEAKHNLCVPCILYELLLRFEMVMASGFFNRYGGRDYG